MNWLLIAHRSELAQPGDYVRLPLPTGDIVAYNDEGDVRVIDGICPHRGARIFTGLHGNRKAVCPYHGWTFRGGEMRVPNAQAYERPGAAQMRGLPMQWVGDWLMAFADYKYDGSAILYLHEFEGFRQFLTDTSHMIAGRHDFGDMRIDCAPEVAVENALEDMHIPMVHHATFAPMDLRRIAQYRIDSNSMAVYDIGDARTRRMVEKLTKYLEFPTGGRYFHLFLHPCVALSSTGGLTFSVQHYLPQSDGSTLFLTRLYRGKTKPAAPDMTSFYDSAADFNAQVFAEDAEICETIIGRGHALASPEEDRVRWFREASR